ncbi:VWA domain-containing protein [Aliikangiella sp. G2MR2-5]|uniref:VWA domain-containing protein n=1 Tax=Aliikangiella sp. G2MR2-5 TaxID=2788943 RepID=UPI0018AB83AD|nr:VWA domain-containing protein [Aliikangiella sp. G2MR2-5]
MTKLKRLATFLLMIAGGTCCLTGVALAKQPKPDVRLLIDISGSMKKNDPNNLRVPALQLVTNLMPQGAEAGVWAFGRYVNMMVPLATVDSSWQKKATATAKKINSAGLYTNIGGVLEKASYGFSTPNPDEKRSIILLTDGMVDISKDSKVNALEREKILNKILPKLVEAKVAIHTIALSQNADHELLKALSNQTDGWYQAVDSAEELQRVFLKIFEQSTDRDSLPLTDNRFKVDASVEEMTLLIFKRQAKDKAKLENPDGQSVSQASSDGTVRWFSTDSYDLITIKSPQVGEWKIDADVDPDNRVMVVSKLGLQVDKVPNNLLAGEAINYQVALLEDGNQIKKKDFLNLVEAKLIQDKNGQSNRLAMFFDGGENSFKQNFYTDDFEGVLNLTLDIRSPTFERTRKHAINIYGNPLTHELELSDSNDMPHKIYFKVRDDIVRADTLKVNLTITHPSAEKQYIGLDDFNVPLEIKAEPSGGNYRIALDIKGSSILGRPFSVSPAEIVFEALPTKEYLAQQAKEPEPEPEPLPDLKQADDGADKEETIEEEPKNEVVDKVEEPANQPVKEPKEESIDWMFWVYLGLGANLILALLGFLGWKLIKKKSHQSSALMADQLGIDEDDEDDDSEDKN